MKRMPDEDSIEKLKELRQEGKSLNAQLAMYLRNKKNPPKEITDKLSCNIFELCQLTSQCFPYHPDEAAVKRMDELDRREKMIKKEIMDMMPDIPAAQLAFLLPIVEESLRKYMLDCHDKEADFRLDCIMSLLSEIYIDYRDRNGVTQEDVDELADHLIECTTLAGYGDYILMKLAGIQECLQDPSEKNILAICVKLCEILLCHGEMVVFEIDRERTEKKKND